MFLTFLESDHNCDSSRREINQLNRKIQDLDEEHRIREKDLQMAVDEARTGESKSQDKVKNLENVVENYVQVSVS